MKLKILFLSFFVLFLCGCDQEFRVEEMQWSAKGDYLAIVSSGKVRFLEGEPPYQMSPIELDALASPVISWSHSANKLIYSAAPNRAWDLVEFDLKDQSKKNITSDRAKDFFPRYLNLEEILFYSDRSGERAPWRYLISSQQFLPFNDPIPELRKEGVSANEMSFFKVLPFKEGSLIQGKYKKKKFKWKEPSLQLSSPRWHPSNQRCAFVARNAKIFKGDLLYIVDFENKKSEWVPLLPEQYLFLAHHFGKGGKGAHLAKAQQLLEKLISLFPKEKEAAAAHFWLGVISGIKKDFISAKKEFELAQTEESRLFLGLESAYFFLGYKLHQEGELVRAIIQYQHALFDVKQTPVRFVVLSFMAQAYLQLQKNDLAIKMWDEVCALAQESEWKEKGRFEIATILKEKKRQNEAAAQIYLKVLPPYQEQAWKELFYLYRDKLFDFESAQKIGNLFLKEYPQSQFWDLLYADLKELNEWFYLGVPEEKLVRYYGANEPIPALAALFSVFLAIETPSVDAKIFEKFQTNAFDLTVKILKQSKGKKLVRLCEKQLKEPTQKDFNLLIRPLLVLGYFSQKEWASAEREAAVFLAQPEATKLQEWYPLIFSIAAFSCEQGKKWEEALAYWNQVTDKEGIALAREHVALISQYRLEDPDGLKELLWVQALSFSDLEFLSLKTPSEGKEILNQIAFDKRPIAPAALLTAFDLLVKERAQENGALRIELETLWQQMSQRYPNTKWEGELLLRLAQFEEADAFFKLAIERYKKVIEKFPQSELEKEAKWLLGRLYLEWPETKEEGLQVLVQVGGRKALLRLAQHYQSVSDDKFISLYRQLIKEHPQSDEAEQALFALAEHFLQKEDRKEALNLYQQLEKRDLDESQLLFARERITLLKTGKKTLHLWREVEEAIVSKNELKINALFEKLLEQSKEESFQIFILTQWQNHCLEAEFFSPLSFIYKKRATLRMSSQDWEQMLNTIDAQFQKGDWASLLEEWSSRKDLTLPTEQKLLTLRAQLFIQEGKKAKAKELIEPHLKQKEILPDLLKQYFLSCH